MSETALGVTFVMLSALFEGFGQVFLKKSVMAKVRWFLWIALAIAFFIIEILLYSHALSSLNVGIAYPIGALSYVAVAILSKLFLNEKVTRVRWIGVCLILAGVGLVAAQA
jgi:multidrug transporter EmrE-like cation transporter